MGALSKIVKAEVAIKIVKVAAAAAAFGAAAAGLRKALRSRGEK